MVDIRAATEQSASVRKATIDDAPKMAEALARAFFHDPVFTWVLHEDPRRVVILRRAFERRSHPNARPSRARNRTSSCRSSASIRNRRDAASVERCSRRSSSAASGSECSRSSRPRRSAAKALYERNGFTVMEESALGKGAPVRWRMWRVPRSVPRDAGNSEG
jgi:hypothetical protein